MAEWAIGDVPRVSRARTEGDKTDKVDKSVKSPSTTAAHQRRGTLCDRCRCVGAELAGRACRAPEMQTARRGLSSSGRSFAYWDFSYTRRGQTARWNIVGTMCHVDAH